MVLTGFSDCSIKPLGRQDWKAGLAPHCHSKLRSLDEQCDPVVAGQQGGAAGALNPPLDILLEANVRSQHVSFRNESSDTKWYFLVVINDFMDLYIPWMLIILQ